MDQILNPFDKLDPLSHYQKFNKIILKIKDKQSLLEIGKLLEKRLNELNEIDNDELK